MGPGLSNTFTKIEISYRYYIYDSPVEDHTQRKGPRGGGYREVRVAFHQASTSKVGTYIIREWSNTTGALPRNTYKCTTLILPSTPRLLDADIGILLM
uniref:Uncharacterized protein n=1 Tax=Picea glauca TaxID=3330 RepID=A0A117NJ51_PICGL|nr:hypothetical protein ABT39_MTgene761 [Picea glauca]QHR90479.1 hypothetical protein Q903MT_gene4503 [Picea sitchensis]